MKAYMIARDDGFWIEQSRDGAATHKEPGNKLPPRLWFKEHQARSWLTTYCKGAQIAKYVESTSDWEIGATEVVKVTQKIEPVEGRTVDRFRILEVLIGGVEDIRTWLREERKSNDLSTN